jgi:ABC-type cobalamin/Fe3+-siderophores transport system ATPase subunit
MMTEQTVSGVVTLRRGENSDRSHVVPGTADGNAVTATGISVRCAAGDILRQVSFSIQQGEFVAILGPNGAGKTTLLRTLSLALPPHSGSLFLLGVDVNRLSARQRMALRTAVGFVPQRSFFNPLIPLTAYDVIASGTLGRRRVVGWLFDEQRERIAAVASQLDVTHLLSRPYRVLSGGEQQKVQIARALVQQPRLLLLDEPTSGLDLTWQRRLGELIEMLNVRHGITIVMTTHHPHHLPEVCKRVLLLREGQIVFDGNPEEGEFAQQSRELFGDIESPSGVGDTWGESGRWFGLGF